VKLRSEYFFDEGHREMFEVMRVLEDRGFTLSAETVKSELMSLQSKALESLTRVVLAEPMPAVLYAVEKLGEWHKKRSLYLGAVAVMQGLQVGELSLTLGNHMGKVIDGLATSEESDTPTFAELEVQFANESPAMKFPTGLKFLDVKSGSGVEAGQLIAVMGGEDAGKTSLLTQILRHMTSCGHKTLFFPLEFSTRKHVAQVKNRQNFNKSLFLLEDRFTDLYDIEAKIKEQALGGCKIFAIDSQMVVTVSGNWTTQEQMESEKFRVLQRLAIKYEIIIFFVCQQSNAHTAGGAIAPMGSKKAVHYVHEIWYIEKQKLEFSADGDESNKGMRNFMRTKSKTGGYFKKPMLLDPKTFEFRGVQYDEDDPRSTKTVGSGRKPYKKNTPVETTVYEMEDAQGNVSALEDPYLWDTKNTSFELPKV